MLAFCRRWGWWYREPANKYTLQIIPSGKECRGWMLGIALGGPLQWGKKTYPSPEAAAFASFWETGDTAQAERLALANSV